MASINSSSNPTVNNIYSALGARNKGIGGLASGLDTDSLVEALTMGTRSKIAKQGQQKQLLNWQMSAYRSTASVLRAFKDTHLNILKPDTYIGSNHFFNSFKGTSSSDKVKLISSLTNTSGKVEINAINQLATAQTIKTDKFSAELKSAASDELFVENYTGKTITLDVDGTSKTIKLDSLNGLSGDSFEIKLQELVDNAFGRRSAQTGETAEADGKVSNVVVSLSGDQKSISLSSANSQVVVVNDSALGFEKESSNRIRTSSTLREVFGDRLLGSTFSISVNGEEFTFNENDKISKVMSDISNSSAKVKVSFSSLTETFSFQSTITGVGDNVQLKDLSGNLLNTWVGAEGASRFDSKSLYAGAVVGDQDFAFTGNVDDLDNMSFVVSVDNASNVYSLKLSDERKQQITDGSLTVEDAILATLNEQAKKNLPDGSLTFSLENGKIKLQNNTNSQIQIWSTSTEENKNGLKVLGFNGTKKNQKISLGYDKTLTGGIVEKTETFLRNFEGKTLTLTMAIGDTARIIKIPVKEDTTKDADGNPIGAGTWDQLSADKWMESALNAAVKKEFGSQATGVAFEIDDAGQVTLNTADGTKVVRLESGDTSSDPNTLVDLYGELGFPIGGIDNQAAGQGTKLNELYGISGPVSFTINGKDFAFQETDTIQDVMNAVNAHFEQEYGSIEEGRIFTVQDGVVRVDAKNRNLSFEDVSGGLMKTLFGVNSYTTPPQDSGKSTTTNGTNAEIVLKDGTVLSNTTNTFNVDGIAFEVSATTEASDGPITLTSNSDPTDLIDKIKTFVDEYNTMIKSLNKVLTEERNSNYKPLTDEQKAEMTQEQIDKWENEAKKGILRNDNTLRTILSDLRATLTMKVEEAGLSLQDIGISTKSLYATEEMASLDFSNDGQLVVNEQKLRSAMEQNPDGVRLLFTSKDGVAQRLTNVIDQAASTSSDPKKRGSLVSLAGTDTLTSDNTSALGNKIDSIDKYVSTLKVRLETEYNRYWKQFTALETAISRMSAQSSWLTQNVG